MSVSHAGSNQITFDYQGKPVMVGIDYRTTSLHNRKGISLSKQLARDKDAFKDLPCHLQRQTGRIAMNTIVSDSLNANSNKIAEYLEPKTTLNTRKDFWVDPKKVRLAKTQRFLD